VLALFDVDGTLIERGDPAHLAAIDDGIHAVLPETQGVSIRQIDFDGKVDRQIVRELLTLAGIGDNRATEALPAIFAEVVRSYGGAWQGRTGDADLLPGARVLLACLAADDRFRLGVLTGGAEGVVGAKLARLGLADRFPVGAFGDAVERRRALLPLARARAEAHYRQTFAPESIVVVGDTPNDVDCAHSGGAACLAVATGRFSMAELAEAGADLVLPDLADTEHVRATMLGLRSRGGR
jgi:phosphoglycolate phosphatase-like HAD superfamily hydrolase